MRIKDIIDEKKEKELHQKDDFSSLSQIQKDYDRTINEMTGILSNKELSLEAKVTLSKEPLTIPAHQKTSKVEEPSKCVFNSKEKKQPADTKHCNIQKNEPSTTSSNSNNCNNCHCCVLLSQIKEDYDKKYTELNRKIDNITRLLEGKYS
eukprot:CAMPEP_0170536122 /NCGR_PEP_ID=MMETSP0209-20121228/101973_1 /TAXON_ID=665100 ORGANISM="Litonotus pictus, Strain P1" /NCGR_SAMPLE_ID=MMETSP0209 /ASSEMBLY_ACC=CAM_ASM_000301 /LENGTH=149 /DNA_ID=CAMNT_0010837455 /DNA_START=444 /DNA_END=893 /DNA_ORIENTATION=+